ncbi:MAG TPA: helix-turn-helix transcriptional regulator [Ramlibacter sp.]|jgi:DNA-binding CsgD family transcriptional regulator|nr:helix-turn-helix transcriptional regulator [Ramlibacter sp.]
MNAAQQELLATAVDHLYTCATEDDQWDTALGAIAQVFDAPRVSVLRTSPGVDRIYEIKALNFDAEAQALYNHYYWQLDPTLDVSRQSTAGAWVDCSPLLDPRTTGHREYVFDYALSHGLRYVAGGMVHLDEQSRIVFGLQRPADARPFADDTKVLFDRLRPHLRRACQISHELQSARRRAALSTAVLDGLAQAAYVVSGDGSLLFANTAGLRQLRLAVPFRHGRGKLQLGAQNTARFEAALAAATSARKRAATDLAESVNGERWVLRVLPMASDPACALVYVAPTARCTTPAAVLQRLFSLTKAEAEIAFHVADGLTVKEIAFERQVSELTVRAQVRSLLAKTGAQRLSALTALMQSIPALRDH